MRVGKICRSSGIILAAVYIMVMVFWLSEIVQLHKVSIYLL